MAVDKTIRVKEIKVNNVKNVLVQIPTFIVRHWDLKENDELEMYINNDDSIVIIPKGREEELAKAKEKL